MPSWGWIILGAFLLGAELLGVDAAFYLVFIGAAAMLTGLILLAGAQLLPWVEWLLFAGFSLIGMVFFRQRIYARFRGVARDYDTGPTGERLILDSPLAPGERCRMEFRGTSWTVLNNGNVPIDAGESAIVQGIDGATLLVESSRTDN